MDQRLNEDDYKKLLLNRFNDPEIKFVKADFKPLSENSEGFMGVHFKLQLTYSKSNTEYIENFFVKNKPFDASSDHPANAKNMYEKEIFIYDILLKEFDKLGYDNSFSPKCYLTVRNETLIMEDVQEKNYRLPARQTFFDETKIKSLLKSLALLHAGSFCFEKTKQISILHSYPTEIQEIYFTNDKTESGFGLQWLKSFLPNFKILIDLLPEDENYKNNFKKLLDKANFGKIFAENHGLKKCVTHGDLWSNNMFFNDTNKCCLVDYQICRYFYPGFDVVLATYSNTDQHFCDNHLENMLQYYYKSFCEICNNYGQNPKDFMTMKEFRKGIDICKMDALLQVAATNCMMFVPADFLQNYITICEKEWEGRDDGVSLGERLKEKQKEFCPLAFKNNEIYKKMITKILSDLNDAMQKNIYNY